MMLSNLKAFPFRIFAINKITNTKNHHNNNNQKFVINNGEDDENGDDDDNINDDGKKITKLSHFIL